MRHRFCKVTGYCERCGLPKDRWANLLSVVQCYPSSAPVTSLVWGRKLKAHNDLKEQLEKSVALAMEGE